MKKSVICFLGILVMGLFLIIQFSFEILRGKIFLLPIAVFFLLGILLLVFIRKEKIKGKLKIFLVLTGLSSISFLVFIFLHNFFYALGILAENIVFLKNLMELLHVIFFLAAIPLTPICFLIGVIGSIILLVKNRGKT